MRSSLFNNASCLRIIFSSSFSKALKSETKVGYKFKKTLSKRVYKASSSSSISADDFSTFYVYLPTDPRAAYLLDLGFTLPESVQKLAGETDDFNITVSRENADQLDDIQLMVVYGDEDLLKSLQEDKLMSQIPAIKNGAVALVDSTSALAGASTPSILSIPYEIDEYLQLLSDAAENIK